MDPQLVAAARQRLGAEHQAPERLGRGPVVHALERHQPATGVRPGLLYDELAVAGVEHRARVEPLDAVRAQRHTDLTAQAVGPADATDLEPIRPGHAIATR